MSSEGLNSATSSFVSAGFVPLLQHVELQDLERRLRIAASRIEVTGRLAKLTGLIFSADLVDNSGSGGRDRTGDLRIMIPPL